MAINNYDVIKMINKRHNKSKFEPTAINEYICLCIYFL